MLFEGSELVWVPQLRFGSSGLRNRVFLVA